MAANMILAGVLAGALAAAFPIDALARGGFVGAGGRASFHRLAGPVFHPRVHARSAVTRIDHRPEVRPVHPISVPGFRSFAFRHHHRRLGPDTFYGGAFYPGAYAVDPGTASDDAATYNSVPACRVQDYVVPASSGESRTVRVLRC